MNLKEQGKDIMRTKGAKKVQKIKESKIRTRQRQSMTHLVDL